MPHDEPVAVAFDSRIGDEVVKVCVVRQGRSVKRGRVEVDQPAEEPEGLRVVQAPEPTVFELDFDGSGLVVQGPDGTIQLE